ncbi:MAG: hypothetical protein ACREA0_22965, partial [bacterium]
MGKKKQRPKAENILPHRSPYERRAKAAGASRAIPFRFPISQRHGGHPKRSEAVVSPSASTPGKAH